MPRFLLAALALASFAVAAPVPKAKKIAPHPHAVGTKWEYMHDGDEKEVWVEEISESKEKDGSITFKVDITTATGAKMFETYRITDGQVEVIGDTDGEYTAPLVFRKGGWKDGDSWECSYTSGKLEYEQTVTVGKAEEITVAAGKYTAVPVTFKYAKPKGFSANTFWYADDVGMIRHTQEGRKEPVQELKAFTPGKK